MKQIHLLSMVNFSRVGGIATSLGQCKNFVSDIPQARKQTDKMIFPHPGGSENLSLQLLKISHDFH